MSDFQPLVESNRRLTEVVETKIEEIDKKVDEATSAVPDTIKEHMNVTVFVDAVSGNDGNTGKTHNSALRTIKAAIESASPNSVVSVILKDGQTHLVSERIQCINKIIMFTPWFYNSNHPTIQVTSFIEDGKLTCGSFDSPREINLYYVDLNMDDCVDIETPWNPYAQGLIRNGDKPIQVQFSMSVGDLGYAGHPVMFSAGRTSLVNASFYNVRLEKRASIRAERKAFDCFGGSMFLIGISFVNSSYTDLIGITKDQFGSVMNLISNYDYS
ncbi:hypothetical protein [Vibrio sp.]|uniref:hypothetical protein n=1 Tax=Vibrio sp. TaxID=678 RepID=UPI0037B0B798